MKPGLANAFLISFIESMADFGNPMVLGGSFNVLATDIFFAIASILLIKGFLEQNGIIVQPLQLSVWAIPTALAAFAVHGGRLLRMKP